MVAQWHGTNRARTVWLKVKVEADGGYIRGCERQHNISPKEDLAVTAEPFAKLDVLDGLSCTRCHAVGAEEGWEGYWLMVSKSRLYIHAQQKRRACGAQV